MKEITVFYTDGTNRFETSVTCETVEEAITAVREELEESEENYTVLADETKERFEIDNLEF